jgi:glyoxylase-like metal-dependent hydrolase (beta-lactamase superfamily II)
MDFEPTDDPSLAPFTEACGVMGDGSLVVVPTPGHLPGSVSMLIRRSDGPPVLLIGDLTYNQELLERDQVAATGDKKLLRDSYAKVRALKQHTPDLVIVAGHDATASEKLTDGTSSSAQPCHGNSTRN